MERIAAPEVRRSCELAWINQLPLLLVVEPEAELEPFSDGEAPALELELGSALGLADDDVSEPVPDPMLELVESLGMLLEEELLPGAVLAGGGVLVLEELVELPMPLEAGLRSSPQPTSAADNPKAAAITTMLLEYMLGSLIKMKYVA